MISNESSCQHRIQKLLNLVRNQQQWHRVLVSLRNHHPKMIIKNVIYNYEQLSPRMCTRRIHAGGKRGRQPVQSECLGLNPRLDGRQSVLSSDTDIKGAFEEETGPLFHKKLIRQQDAEEGQLESKHKRLIKHRWSSEWKKGKSQDKVKQPKNSTSK